MQLQWREGGGEQYSFFNKLPCIWLSQDSNYNQLNCTTNTLSVQFDAGEMTKLYAKQREMEFRMSAGSINATRSRPVLCCWT